MDVVVSQIKFATMKKLLFALCFFSCVKGFAQTEETAGKQFYNKLFDYDFVERKPIFPFTADSLRNFYLSHFTAFDSLIGRCIERGDTAKYIRVHFEFILDESGVAYDPKFLFVGSIRYKSGSSDKKIKYFDDLKTYFNDATKQMIKMMPSWRPALQNNVRVNCRKEDFFQFWLGINPPTE